MKHIVKRLREVRFENMGLKHAQTSALNEVNIAVGFPHMQQPGLFLYLLELKEGKRYMKGKTIQD